MNKIGKIKIALCALTIMLCLCACGESEDIKNDIAVDTLADTVAAAAEKTDSMIKRDESYVQGFMRMDVSAYEGFAVLINAYGANIDEFGIFKGSADQIKDIEAAVNDYLKLRLDTWMEEYMPEEKPKLTSAEVKTVGNYVMYCILSEDDAKAAFEAFENSLKK